MNLKFEEIKFFNDHNNYFLCTLNTFGKLEFKNLAHIYNPQKNMYCFDISLALFENLTTAGINYIDNIFEKGPEEMKGRYINKKRWSDHKYFEEFEVNEYGEYRRPDVPEIDLGRPRLYIGSNNKDSEIKRELYEDGSIELTQEEIDNLYKKLTSKKGRKKLNMTRFCMNKKEISNFCKNMNVFRKEMAKCGNTHIEEYLCYSISIEDEIELIRYFFELIFSLPVRCIIKKCERCEKYFLTTENHKIYCNREYKNNTTCSEYKSVAKGQYKKGDPIYTLEERVRSKCRSNNDAYYKFLDEKVEMKVKYKNNPKKYTEWLLSHYNTEEKKEKIKSEIKGLKDILEKYN